MSFEELWNEEHKGKQIWFFKKHENKKLAYRWFTEGQKNSEWNYLEDGKYPEHFGDVLIAHRAGGLQFLSLGFYDGNKWHGHGCSIGTVFAWKEERLPSGGVNEGFRRNK